jgi:hypothetical protein
MTWKQDYTALILTYVYLFGVIALAELLRRAGRRPPDFTRKFIHIGVGMWVVGTALLFETWWVALIPPATFVVINAISYWRGVIKAMETGDRGNLGTIYFPISFGALVFYFWGMPVLMVASMIPLYHRGAHPFRRGLGGYAVVELDHHLPGVNYHALPGRQAAHQLACSADLWWRGGPGLHRRRGAHALGTGQSDRPRGGCPDPDPLADIAARDDILSGIDQRTVGQHPPPGRTASSPREDSILPPGRTASSPPAEQLCALLKQLLDHALKVDDVPLDQLLGGAAIPRLDRLQDVAMVLHIGPHATHAVQGKVE